MRDRKRTRDWKKKQKQKQNWKVQWPDRCLLYYVIFQSSFLSFRHLCVCNNSQYTRAVDERFSMCVCVYECRILFTACAHTVAFLWMCIASLLCIYSVYYTHKYFIYSIVLSTEKNFISMLILSLHLISCSLVMLLIPLLSVRGVV